MSLEKSTIKNIEKYLDHFYTKNFEQEYLDYDIDFPIKRETLNKKLISQLPEFKKKNLMNISIKITIK